MVDGPLGIIRWGEGNGGIIHVVEIGTYIRGGEGAVKIVVVVMVVVSES